MDKKYDLDNGDSFTIQNKTSKANKTKKVCVSNLYVITFYYQFRGKKFYCPPINKLLFPHIILLSDRELAGIAHDIAVVFVCGYFRIIDDQRSTIITLYNVSFPA